ncbi:MAG: HD domain-containing protein [Lachnospiraceae bacterium]|nr:HD domain-containing protein [Lachnospiraceae bacterium]
MEKNKIRTAFADYVSEYDASDPKIALKISHTYRVAELCEKIAQAIGSNDADTMLAWTIGMLHDIARFEQVRIYNTFIDKESVDHADFAVKLLFEDGLIERFVDIGDEENFDIIKKAIQYHNKYRLPDNLGDRELLFCKIIRDADKVDIIRVNYDTPMEEIYNTTREILMRDSITDEVYEAFFEESAINHSIKRSKIDALVGHVSLCFELEFDISREILKEQGYLFKLLNFESENEETAIRLKNIREYIRDYLDRDSK